MIVSFSKYAWLGGVCLLTSCLTHKAGHRLLDVATSYCEPSLVYAYDTSYLPRPDNLAVLQSDTALIRRFSRHDLLMANAAGVLPLLRELVKPENITSDHGLVALGLRQKITSRLLLVSTEVSSLAAELDCEGERANQLAIYLDQRDSRRVKQLTILSVVVSAVTTVITTVTGSGNVAKAVGVGGGLTSAGFGGLAAFSSNKTVQFMHTHNLLTDIWQQARRSTVYSPSVWYVLNEKLFSNSGQHAISYNIRQRWLGYILNGASPEKEQLYFGAGGNYQADELHTRSTMLNQLQSSVRSINQDLQSLMLNLPK